MANMTSFQHKILHLAMALMLIVARVDSQSSSSVCTGPMMRSFNSCIGFLSGGSNASSPTAACCNSLRDLMSNGQDCLCLIVTGGVPFQVPINRSLAISLPKACRQSGVPIECKATSSPVPAPEPRTPPGAGGPSMYPGLSPPSPRGTPSIPQPFTPPSPSQGGSGGGSGGGGGGGGGFTPPQGSEGDFVPTLTPPGMRPTLTPSAAHIVLPSLLVEVLGVMMLIYY